MKILSPIILIMLISCSGSDLKTAKVIYHIGCLDALIDLTQKDIIKTKPKSKERKALIENCERLSDEFIGEHITR